MSVVFHQSIGGIWRWGTALAWAAFIWISSSRPVTGRPAPFPHADKLVHAVLFGILAWLLFRAIDRAGTGVRIRAGIAALALASLYGGIDEWHQRYVPTRNCDGFDWLADVAGALIMLIVIMLVRSIRTKTRQGSESGSGTESATGGR